jgi:hypothetical protein
VTASLDDLVVALAAAGLPGSLRTLPEEELSESLGDQLVAAAERLLLAGMVVASVQAGKLRLPPRALAAMIAAQDRETATRRRLEQQLPAATARLEQAGIEARVVDGSAVAYLDYPDPSLRAVPSLDLLVLPTESDAAIAALRRDGWHPLPSRSSGRLPEAALIHPSDVRLNLRTTVDPGLRGLSVRVSELWTDAQEFVIGSRQLRALGSEQRLLQASCSVAAGGSPPLLVYQRDLVEMILFGGWEHRRLMRLATSWRALPVLAHTVRTAWRRLAIADVTGLSVWAEAYSPSPTPLPPGHTAFDAFPEAPAQPWGKIRSLLARRS